LDGFPRFDNGGIRPFTLRIRQPIIIFMIPVDKSAALAYSSVNENCEFAVSELER
jgi:hypothetical protein